MSYLVMKRWKISLVSPSVSPERKFNQSAVKPDIKILQVQNSYEDLLKRRQSKQKLRSLSNDVFSIEKQMHYDTNIG